MGWWPFGKKEADPETLDFLYSEEVVPESPKVAGQWHLEMDVSVRRLAALYMEYNWLLQVDDKTAGIPLPNGLLSFIANQADALADSEALYLGLGRLLFLKDEDFGDGIDIFLHLGTATFNPTLQEAISE